MPGDVRNRNTCSIAAIDILPGVTPTLEDKLSLLISTWQQVIWQARSLWSNKYEFDTAHHGQHDAAEFFGDLLFGDRSIGIKVARRTSTGSCAHSWTMLLSEMFLVLELPAASFRLRTFRVSGLTERCMSSEILSDLQCDVCGSRHQVGSACRVNRLTLAEKCLDEVLL